MADMRRGCEHEKLVDEALRTLLLCKLEQQQDTMVHDHHGVADNDFKLRAQRVYDAYHGLGGNGHGTQVNNDIQCAHCAPAGRKAIMSITINGVKPGTATLTIRAGTQSVDAPVTVREHLRRWLPMPATMFGVTYADARLRVRLCKTNQSPTPVGLLL